MPEIHYEKLPDVVNCSPDRRSFTQIPNEILRDPALSYKAKGILALLLSNKEGWKTCITTLCKMSSDGLTAIQSGIQELEQSRYVKRVRYRDKRTKQYIGSFWGITDTAGKFKLHQTVKWIKAQGWEVVWPKHVEKPDMENLDMGKVDVDNRPLKRTIIKRTNFKKTNLLRVEEEDSNITDSQFTLFWESYPKKVDKGKAFTAWTKLCNKPAKTRPTMQTLLKAIQEQKKSERWQDSQFIPLPTTWLNNNRWLDDPEEMKNFSFHQSENNGKKKFSESEESFSNPDNKTVYPKGRGI